MLRTTKYPFVHVIAVLVSPLFFACAHATKEEALDGYVEAMTGNPALMDPVTAAEVTQLPVEQSETKLLAAARKAKPSQRAKKSAPKIVEFAPKPEAVPAPIITPVVPSPGFVPTGVVQKSGANLNRYYFVRAGDGPETLSQLLYGDKEHAKKLVEWNGAPLTWEPGKVLYYQSALDPLDPSVVSYYSEANTRVDEIALGDGEDLKVLAARLYGSPDSWREIATLNATSSATGLSKGARVKVYALPATEREIAQAPVAAEKDPKLASAQVASFIQHNPLIVACSLVAFVLLGAYLFMQRRRYRSRFDF